MVWIRFSVAACALLLLMCVQADKPAAQESAEPAIRFATATGIVNLDPHRATDRESLTMIACVYDTLYQWIPGDGFEVAPLLATGMPEFSEDGLTATIHLRDDAVFHPSEQTFRDNEPRAANANDVVASLTRAMAYHKSGMGWMLHGLVVGLDDIGTVRPTTTSHRNEVIGLEAIGTHTVRIRLTRPYGALARLLAHPVCSVVPLEVMDGRVGNMATRAVGTGPYRLSAIAAGELCVLSANENYHSEQPEVQRVALSRARYWEEYLAGVRLGQLARINIHPRFESEVMNARGELHGPLQDAGCSLEVSPGHGYYFVAFNMGRDKLGGLDADGRALRKAINHSIDRAVITGSEKFAAGASAAQEGSLPHETEFEDLPSSSGFGVHDRAKALELLAGTRFEGGVDPANGEAMRLELMIRGDTWEEPFIQAIREGLEALGMELNTRTVESEQYMDQIRTSDSDLFISGWFLDYPCPLNFLQLFMSANVETPAQFHNVARYRSEAFDSQFSALEALVPTADNRAQRRRLTSAMLRILHEDQPIMPMVRMPETWLHSGRIDWPDVPVQTYSGIRFAKPAAQTEGE
jgi:ABC-type transport system substrate-binding protein